MKSPRALILIAICLYLAVGIGLQLFTCAVTYPAASADGTPPDIPCAGVVWTPIIVGMWPYMALFNLLYGLKDGRWDLFGQGIVLGITFISIIIALIAGIRKAAARAPKQAKH